ncbi:hypothetical protein TGME49_291340 [Toxoplasma gondii ME49]|uniref:Uncharacterized protein n=3 Tax=Toxoplasma gondii TaxID=5811 RepID=S8F0D1_TOXGM|nr:hypothetical protein TGME49_291340 [Toxoplasma gondii ME49]EPT28082.1 hypothetical protein TGME49_291340 [Toxoplasma gondii ME49]KYF44962.1 hypothetical protein TGARI_291340 [Toxoplasma gondii ARI]|eukprot:XP_002368508.1 hypothetical protein TGME49_291340 [Toxoplasma gondii ME49]
MSSSTEEEALNAALLRSRQTKRDISDFLQELEIEKGACGAQWTADQGGLANALVSDSANVPPLLREIATASPHSLGFPPAPQNSSTAGVFVDGSVDGTTLLSSVVKNYLQDKGSRVVFHPCSGGASGGTSPNKRKTETNKAKKEETDFFELDTGPLAQLDWITEDEGCLFSPLTKQADVGENSKEADEIVARDRLGVQEPGTSTVVQLLTAEREAVLRQENLISKEEFTLQLKVADELLAGWRVVERLDLAIEQRESQLRNLKVEIRRTRERMRLFFHAQVAALQDKAKMSAASALALAPLPFPAPALEATSSSSLPSEIHETSFSLSCRSVDLMLCDRVLCRLDSSASPLHPALPPPTYAGNARLLATPSRDSSRNILSLLRRKRGEESKSEVRRLPPNLRQRRRESLAKKREKSVKDGRGQLPGKLEACACGDGSFCTAWSAGSSVGEIVSDFWKSANFPKASRGRERRQESEEGANVPCPLLTLEDVHNSDEDETLAKPTVDAARRIIGFERVLKERKLGNATSPRALAQAGWTFSEKDPVRLQRSSSVWMEKTKRGTRQPRDEGQQRPEAEKAASATPRLLHVRRLQTRERNSDRRQGERERDMQTLRSRGRKKETGKELGENSNALHVKSTTDDKERGSQTRQRRNQETERETRREEKRQKAKRGNSDEARSEKHPEHQPDEGRQASLLCSRSRESSPPSLSHTEAVSLSPQLSFSSCDFKRTVSGEGGFAQAPRSTSHFSVERRNEGADEEGRDEEERSGPEDELNATQRSPYRPSSAQEKRLSEIAVCLRSCSSRSFVDIQDAQSLSFSRTCTWMSDFPPSSFTLRVCPRSSCGREKHEEVEMLREASEKEPPRGTRDASLSPASCDVASSPSGGGRSLHDDRRAETAQRDGDVHSKLPGEERNGEEEEGGGEGDEKHSQELRQKTHRSAAAQKNQESFIALQINKPAGENATLFTRASSGSQQASPLERKPSALRLCAFYMFLPIRVRHQLELLRADAALAAVEARLSRLRQRPSGTRVSSTVIGQLLAEAARERLESNGGFPSSKRSVSSSQLSSVCSREEPQSEQEANSLAERHQRHAADRGDPGGEGDGEDPRDAGGDTRAAQGGETLSRSASGSASSNGLVERSRGKGETPEVEWAQEEQKEVNLDRREGQTNGTVEGEEDREAEGEEREELADAGSSLGRASEILIRLQEQQKLAEGLLREAEQAVKETTENEEGLRVALSLAEDPELLLFELERDAEKSAGETAAERGSESGKDKRARRLTYGGTNPKELTRRARALAFRRFHTHPPAAKGGGQARVKEREKDEAARGRGEYGVETDAGRQTEGEEEARLERTGNRRERANAEEAPRGSAALTGVMGHLQEEVREVEQNRRRKRGERGTEKKTEITKETQ